MSKTPALAFSDAPANPERYPVGNVKATYYLPQSLADEVDDMRLFAREQGARVDKSRLVRTCIELAFHRYPDELIDMLKEDT